MTTNQKRFATYKSLSPVLTTQTTATYHFETEYPVIYSAANIFVVNNIMTLFSDHKDDDDKSLSNYIDKINHRKYTNV